MHWYKYANQLVSDDEWTTTNPDDVDCHVCLKQMKKEGFD